MFERFADESRAVLVRTNELGDTMGSPHLRRHHILIATIDHEDSDPDGVVTQIFDDAEVDRAALRQVLVESLTGSETPTNFEGSRPFSGGAKKALEMALREALALGHNYISSAHLLLAILRTADGPLEDALSATKLDYDRARGVARRVAPDRYDRRRGGRGRRGGPSQGRGRRSREDAFSLGLRQVLSRLDEAVDGRLATTGDLLIALVGTPNTHFAAILGTTSLADTEAVKTHAAQLVDSGALDGEDKSAVSVDPETGAVTIHDPAMAKKVLALLRDR